MLNNWIRGAGSLKNMKPPTNCQTTSVIILIILITVNYFTDGDISVINTKIWRCRKKARAKNTHYDPTQRSYGKKKKQGGEARKVRKSKRIGFSLFFNRQN